MKAEYWSDATSRKAAPVGAYSAAALAFVAASSLLFRVFGDSRTGGRVFIWPFLIAYLVLCPAVACSLYSLVFEPLKRFAAVGLLLGGFAVFAFPLMADSVILLPFAFLGVMGVVKFVRWRTEKSQPHLPHSAG